MGGLRADLALFGDPLFARFFVARTVGGLGASFAPVALAFSVLHLPHGTPELLSTVLAWESLPMVALMLLGGVIADRFPRVRVVRVGMLLSASAFVLLGTFMLVGWTPTVALCAAAALSGIGIALLYPALTGLIPEILSPDHLQAGNGLLGAARNTSQIVGLVASGAVVALVGGPWALVAGGTLFAAGVLFTLGIPLGVTHPDGLSAASALADLKGGWREFTSHEWLWVIVAQWSLLVLFFSAATGVIGPVLANAELGGALPWSWILAGEAVGMLIGGLLAMRLKLRRPILVAVVATGVAVPVPFLCLGLGAPLAVDILAMAASGAAFGVFGVMWSTTMQLRVPPEALSRVASYDALGSLVFQPVGLLVGGPLTVVLGHRTAMLVCAASLIVVCALSLGSRDVRTVGWSDTSLLGAS